MGRLDVAEVSSERRESGEALSVEDTKDAPIWSFQRKPILSQSF